MARVLETVLTGRNLLSPVLASAGRDVAAFNATVSGSYDKAAATAGKATAVQQGAAAGSARASATAAEAAASGATVQSTASSRVVAANGRNAESAAASAATQSRAHAKAAESATLAARAQQAASAGLTASNGLLGTSLTPLTAGLGAVALGMGYAAYRGMEFDRSMSAVQAASMASAGDMGRLRTAALEAGASTQYSAVEAAQGVTELSKAGVATADILSGGLKGALNLAAAGQMDVAAAAELGATAMNVFNLEGDQMNHVADLLAAGAGKAQGSVGDLGQALNQSALLAAQTGISIEDTAGALAMFASNGLTGSDAGTSFKTMLQGLTPNSAAAARAMDEMGLRAYDAQGNFVGLEAYAGQLRTGLAGLTEEQRAQTLETIFGADAVRAASVLYKEGAAGVAEWADKVNDSGFASRQAAILNDNLAGDIERLGGSFDAAMTAIGSGTQGPLRFLVQRLTDLIDAGGDVIGFISDLPGPVQAAAASFAALYLMTGPLAGVFPFLLTQLKSIGATLGPVALGIRAAAMAAVGSAEGMAAFGLATTAARTALIGLMTTVAPFLAVAAIVALTMTIIDNANAADEARKRVDELTAAYDDAPSGEKYGQLAGAIDQVRAAAKDARTDLAEIQDASLWDKFWSWDYQGDVDAAQAAVDATSERLDELEAAAGRAETSIGVLGRRYGMSRADVIAFAEAHGIDLAGNLQIAQTEFMRLADGAGAAEIAQASVRTEMKSLEDQVDGLREALDQLNGGTLTVNAASRDYQQSLAEVRDRIAQAAAGADGYSLSLDRTTEAGRSNEAALDEVATSAMDVAMAVFQANGDYGTFRGSLEAARQDLFNQARAFFATEEQTWAYVDSVLAIPDEATTNAIANTATANANVNGLAANVNALPDGNVDVYVNTNPGEASLRAFITARRDAINLSVVTGSGTSGSGGPNRRIATGGRLTGPGTGTSDSILGVDAGTGAATAWVSNGEYVVNRAQTDRNLALVEAINAGLVPANIDPEQLRYLAGGGQVYGQITLPLNVDTSSAERSLSAMATAFAAQGVPAGGGALGGSWQSIFNVVKAAIPQARQNSTYRPGDPGYHGRNKAVDFGFGSGPGGAGSAGLALINRFLHDNYGSKLAELIYDGIGDDRPDLKNGRPLTYSAATRRQHTNHVHAAVYDTGGRLDHGAAAINLSGRPEGILTNEQLRWLQAAADVGTTATAAARGFYTDTVKAVARGISDGLYLAEDGSWVPDAFYDGTTASVAAGISAGMQLAEDGSWVPASFYAGITGAIRAGMPGPAGPPAPGYIQAEDGSWVRPSFYARAQGGDVWPGQLFKVGENGPEWATFGAPGTVYPAGPSPAAMPGYGGAPGARAGGQQVVVIERRTEIAVDARGDGADGIATKIERQQRRRERAAGL